MKYIWLIAATILLSACGHDPLESASYFTENAERVRIGLRTIKPQWEHTYTEFNVENWLVSDGQSGTKRIHRRSAGAIISETDAYYNGRTYQTRFDGTSFESLTLIYHYDKKRAFIHVTSDNPALQGIKETLESYSEGWAGKTDPETFEVARKIMVLMELVTSDTPWEQAVQVEGKSLATTEQTR